MFVVSRMMSCGNHVGNEADDDDDNMIWGGSNGCIQTAELDIINR